MDVPVPEAQHSELGVVDLVQRLPPIRASPPSVRRSELQRRAQQKLKEASYVHAVLKAVRSTIHNDRWMREHDAWEAFERAIREELSP